MPVRVFFAALVVLMVFGGSPASASEKAKNSHNGNSIAAKVPQNYVQLPKMRLAVPLDNNRTYRMLELEVWLAMEKPEDAAKLSSERTKITAKMKELFMGYKWEAFLDPNIGFALAKAVVRASVDQSIKGGPPVDEVIIRTMLLR